MNLPTNPIAWDAACAGIVTAMQAFVQPYMTLISRIITDTESELLGTGSYIEALGRRLLMTNEHNVSCVEKNSLAAQLHGNDGVFRLKNSAPVLRYPVDCAFILIGDDVWTNTPGLQPHNAKAASPDQMAIAHTPIKDELIFFQGYAGDN